MFTPLTPALVAGATGRQSSAIASRLIKAGAAVRVLVQDPSAREAAAVALLGAELVTGDLRKAVDGVRSVFAVQTPGVGPVSVAPLIDAARNEGVAQFVLTWDCGTEPATAQRNRETEPALRDRVREAGFAHWTLLEPALLMENFLPPSPLLPQDPGLDPVTAWKSDTEVSLTAVADIGAAAAAVFTAPERFHGTELDLAGDRLPRARIAEILSRAAAGPSAASQSTAPPVTAVHSENDPASPGIPLTRFADWAHRRLRTATLEERVQRLEDRAAIVERVITYAPSIDRKDWQALAACFTDPLVLDASRRGAPAGRYSREAYMERMQSGLGQLTETQHISPNHIVEWA
ncbi:NmrA family NAD(P)-binding protein [Yinghuangia sp. YIM S09857]|uniref:NmrA family NAD(P)-binding protein n=1 Tax=Yinghuangia sp. YIM S09857 TaxID=3436929 RepID=UPI003F539103